MINGAIQTEIIAITTPKMRPLLTSSSSVLPAPNNGFVNVQSKQTWLNCLSTPLNVLKIAPNITATKKPTNGLGNTSFTKRVYIVSGLTGVRTKNMECNNTRDNQEQWRDNFNSTR